MTKKQTIAASKIFVGLLIAVFALGACAQPSGSGDIPAGSVAVSLGAAVSARSATAATAGLVSSYSISITDAKGATHTGTGTDSGATTIISDVYPGAFTVSVITYGSSGTVNGSGSGSGTLAEGGSASVNISIAITQSTAGDMDLDITFPTDRYITAVDAAFIVGDSAYGTILTASSDVALGTATFSASGIGSGTHYLAIGFYEGGELLGRIVESINIWDGATTNLWVAADGSTAAYRAFTADEIAGKTAELRSLTVAGKDVDLEDALTPAGADITGDAGSYIADDTIAFVAIGGAFGQSITYTWNGVAGSLAVASGTAIEVSGGDAAGFNTLVITVTSPGGVATNVYTVTYKRAYSVRFVTAYGTAPAAQTVLYGVTATAPVDPTADGFGFGGWYTDDQFTVAWSFSTPITSNQTLYAKWTTLGSITAYLTEPEYLGIYFKRGGNIIRGTPLDKDGTLILSVPTGATSYTWYIDTTVAAGQTTASFSFNPSSSGITAGIYTVSVVAVYNGVSYSGNLAVTVTNDAMITIVPKGTTASFTEKTYSYGVEDYAPFTHTLTRPYKLGKFEVSYQLWSVVYSWAIGHGYAFANAGADGWNLTSGLPTGVITHPVTKISFPDAIVWCNAYSEMMAYTPCYYTSTGGRTTADVLRSAGSVTEAYPSTFVDWSAGGYRLPTEGEWHYAATCGNYYAYNQVSGATVVYTESDSTYMTWANASTDSTLPCGSKIPNIWGFYDMSGNMWEWCFDTCVVVPSGAQTDYVSDAYSTARVVRGGSFNASHPVGKTTVGHRDGCTWSLGAADSGFRLARTIQ